MSDNTCEHDALIAMLIERGSLVSDLRWALEWLDSLTDDLNTLYGKGYHPRTLEFLEELRERRKQSVTLNNLAEEVDL